MKIKKIKWINRYSLDSGYIGRLKKDHFENTFDINKAKVFKDDEIPIVLELLNGYENNNDYIPFDENNL